MAFSDLLERFSILHCCGRVAECKSSLQLKQSYPPPTKTPAGYFGRELSWLLLVAVLGMELPIQAGILIDSGSDWKYALGTPAASSPDQTAWRKIAFNDTLWQSGPTPIGYANPPGNPDENSLITQLPSSQEGNYLSVLFRKAFPIKNPALITQLTLGIKVDDGFVAWINGTMVARYNVPEGELDFSRTASIANEENLVTTLLDSDLDHLLTAGTNLLAVQVFNASRSSSDLFFNASLASDVDDVPPVVNAVVPLPNSVVRELKHIEIAFDGNVQGVDAADLLINNRPASNVTAYSPREYLFEFAQPAAGKVEIAWAANHGIADGATPPNAFAGGGWSYTLNPNTPSTMVVISEFMADNQNGIRDDLGDRSDWIEIHNRGSSFASLEGWYLTDDANNLARWRFPALTLGANQYLLIWASGENRTNPAAPLHTSFKLNKNGGYLALSNSQTNLVSDFAPSYPVQPANISYGRDQMDSAITGYFFASTPGAPNVSSGPGFAPEPVFSLESGLYTNSSLTLTLSAPIGKIYYTINGSEPGTNSMVYRTPLVITSGTVVKARVFQTGLLPSRMVARVYNLLEPSARSFSSNLPLLIINTAGRGISQDMRLTNVSFTVINTHQGRSSLLLSPEFQGLCQVERRGQTSASFPKVPYRIEINDEMAQDLDVPLLGMPADSDWVLRNPYSDKCLMNDFLASELHEKMGHYAPRRQFVEVFVSTAVGKLSYPGNYQGVYVLMEEIKAGKNRLNIEQMSPGMATEPNISGGYILKKDKPSPGDLTFTTTGGGGFSRQELRFDEPKSRVINSAQQNWIRNYLSQFERCLYAANWTNATGTNHYAWYIDVDSFVDQHWIVEFTKQIDGYRLSNYMHKDRGGRLHMDPIWDWNLSFGNADYLDGWITSGWYYALLNENDHIWLRRLICGSPNSTAKGGDADFNQKITDRWCVLRTNILAASNVLARVDELASQLNEAASRDFAKFPRLGTYVWPNPSFYTTPTTYQGIINAMKQWIQGRYNWIDSQFIKSPSLSLPEGSVTAGSLLTISAPVGLIYYTLDGTDPRRSGGTISSTALVSSGPLALHNNARVVARAKSGSNWSGPSAATYVVRTPPLAITEIMYHPQKPGPGSPYQDQDFEYLEFKNLGNAPLELGGIKLSGEVEFTFPPMRLAAQQTVLVVRNQAAFRSRYGSEPLIAGEFKGALNNVGGRLALQGPLQEPILDFSYDNQGYPITDGPGFSLTVVNEQTPLPAWNQNTQWRPSSLPNGSPGQTDPPITVHPPIVINEIFSHPDSSLLDAVEVRNLSPIEVDMGGWFLTDDLDTPQKYRIPDGTMIGAGGFLVFTENEFNSPTGAAIPFKLSSYGEEVFLFSGDAQTNLTGYAHGFRFGAQSLNVTFGLHLTSQGEEHFVTQKEPTLGSTNAGPRIDPIVISEIMYHPPDIFTNGTYWNNRENEYVELYNRSSTSACLFNSAPSSPRWRLAGTVDFEFPTNTVLAGNSCLLVVSFDPIRTPAQAEIFRAKFRIPESVAILGPYRGSLRNGDKAIRFEKRDDSSAISGFESNSWILVECINYADQFPWPTAPDGLGYALHRKDPSLYGNDPSHWEGTVPTPGFYSASGAPPTITRQPISQMAMASETVTLTAAAQSDSPLRYQWCFNGSILPGATNASLILSQVQPSQTGSYQLLAMNSENSASSHPAWLAVDWDRDKDFVGDNWERAHGLDPSNPLDAGFDPDQDGLNNQNEFLAGTDPLSRENCPRLEAKVDSGNVILSFHAVSNRTYTVQYSNLLKPAHWLRLADIASLPTNSSATLIDIGPSESRYYRLLTPAAP